MNIDLSKCVIGQKVVTRGGEIGTFAGDITEPEYPYIGVFTGDSTKPEYPYRIRFTGYNGPRTYTREGYWFTGADIYLRNIVAILPLEDSPASDPELLEENAKLKAQIADLELEVSMLKAEYDALKDEYEALKSESNKLKDEICALAVRLTRLCRD